MSFGFITYYNYLLLTNTFAIINAHQILFLLCRYSVKYIFAFQILRFLP